tara:strand:- start:1571 stop:1891 length:321 start_codon:yes stop_codon:yes gene_type:complete
MKITTTDNKGIHLECSDGKVFSIQFGAGNYCDNYDNDMIEQFEKKPNTSSENAEVAVWQKDGEWETFKHFPGDGDHEEGHSDVVGHKTIIEILETVLKHEQGLHTL